MAVPALSVYDDGAGPGGAPRGRITDEGLPCVAPTSSAAGSSSALARWYEANACSTTPPLAAKLGAGTPEAERALVARNGFGRDASGARAFDMAPAIAATNVWWRETEATGRDELLRSVGQGPTSAHLLHVPVKGSSRRLHVHGLRRLVLDPRRRLRAPLRANAVRINDNIGRLLRSIVAIGKDPAATPVWGADEIVYAPAIAAAGVPVEAISTTEDEG